MNVLQHGRPFFCDEAGLPPVTTDGIALKSLAPNGDADFYYDYDRQTETFPQILKRINKSWKPDLALFWAPEMYPPPLEVEESEIPTAAIVSDWNVYFTILIKNAARFDVVISDKRGAQVLANDLWQPQYICPIYAHNPRIHFDYGLVRDIDVLFVGNLNHAAHVTRARFLERLARLSRDYRICITTGVYGEAYGKLLNRAKIVFNHSLRGELNLRVFETLACASVPLLEEENLEVRDWLVPNEEIALYNTGNFEDCIRSILSDKARQKTMIERGKTIQRALSAERRLSRIVTLVTQQGAGARRFRDLDHEEQQFETAKLHIRAGSGISPSEAERVIAKYLKEQMERHPGAATLAGIVSLTSGKQDTLQREKALTFFRLARSIAPRSAPYAFNASVAAEICGDTTAYRLGLMETLNRDSLEGAEDLVGHAGEAFYVQWHRAVAEHQTTLNELHREVLVRLAMLDGREGNWTQAKRWLAKARELNTAHSGWIRPFVESLWNTGQQTEAANLLLASVEQFPLDFEVRESLCQMLMTLERKKEARALAEDTLALARAFTDLSNPAENKPADKTTSSSS